MRNEYTANDALQTAALERQRVMAVMGATTLRPLSGSKVVQRQRYQKVAKKQHTVVWFSVMLIASALIGALLAY